MVDREGELVEAEAREQWDEDGAELGDRELGQQRLVAVPEPDEHQVAAADAVGRQAGGQPTQLEVELREAPGAALAVQEDPVRGGVDTAVPESTAGALGAVRRDDHEQPP